MQSKLILPPKDEEPELEEKAHLKGGHRRQQ